MTMTIVHLMQGNVTRLVEDAVNITFAFLNAQDTETMTMTIVHLMQGNVPGLVEDAVIITLAFLMFMTPRP
jgi:hypothetical protein